MQSNMKKNYLQPKTRLPKGAYMKDLTEAVESYAQKAITDRVGMNWNNLTKNKCPKCNKDFVGSTKIDKTNAMDKKMIHSCGFQIRESTFARIVSGQVGKSIERSHEEVDSL